MWQERLYGLALRATECELLDEVYVENVAYDFVFKVNHRSIFIVYNVF